MPHIVLTPEQAEVLERTVETVELRDNQGRVLARVSSPVEAGVIEMIESNRRLNLPLIPGEQVMARLSKLEEIRQREGMDKTKMRELLRRMRAGEEI